MENFTIRGSQVLKTKGIVKYHILDEIRQLEAEIIKLAQQKGSNLYSSAYSKNLVSKIKTLSSDMKRLTDHFLTNYSF